MIDRLADQFARLLLYINDNAVWTVLAIAVVAFYLLIRVSRHTVE